MELKEIIHKIEQKYPQSLAMKWDNPGLQVGRNTMDIRRVLIAVDATNEVLDACIDQEIDLLLTHHPLILSGVKKVSTEDYLGEKALRMAENHVAHYAMHTNYDIRTMGTLAAQVLKLEQIGVLDVTGQDETGEPCGIGCVGRLPKKMSAKACCEYVKEAFQLPNVRLFGDGKKEVSVMAVCPGSGKSDISSAIASGAEIYVTGDIGHHDGIDAVDQGLVIIDAGHYGVEKIFIPEMETYMKQEFPALEVITMITQLPYQVV